MYLSKLILNPRSREARRDAAVPYELHRTLARAFVTELGVDYRATHGVLFRMEPLTHRDERPTVLVQSMTEPDWSKLPEGYCHTPTSILFNTEFDEGQTFQFRLSANPTRKQKREGQKQGQRVALLDTLSTDAEADGLTPAQAWLSRKGQQHGFAVLWATSDGFWHGVDRGGSVSPVRATKQSVSVYGVRFDGVLRITEPSLFTDALKTGIGPAKAFGFGLLSLAQYRH